MLQTNTLKQEKSAYKKLVKHKENFKQSRSRTIDNILSNNPFSVKFGGLKINNIPIIPKAPKL